MKIFVKWLSPFPLPPFSFSFSFFPPRANTWYDLQSSYSFSRWKEQRKIIEELFLVLPYAIETLPKKKKPKRKNRKAYHVLECMEQNVVIRSCHIPIEPSVNRTFFFVGRKSTELICVYIIDYKNLILDHDPKKKN